MLIQTKTVYTEIDKVKQKQKLWRYDYVKSTSSTVLQFEIMLPEEQGVSKTAVVCAGRGSPGTPGVGAVKGSRQSPCSPLERQV
jgi:hypothetical protein